MNPSQLEQITQEVHTRLKQVISVDHPSMDEDLCGACLIGACVLYERLVRLGLNPELVYGRENLDDGGDHFWVIVGGWLLDPTYSQYGGTDWLVLPSTTHPEEFDEIRVGAPVPTPEEWGVMEHPEGYWRRFCVGSWRRSRVRGSGKHQRQAA